MVGKQLIEMDRAIFLDTQIQVGSGVKPVVAILGSEYCGETTMVFPI